MKNVKRYLALALAAFTVTALFAGCGKKETPEPTEKENPTGITEVEKTEAPTEEQTEVEPENEAIVPIGFLDLTIELPEEYVGNYLTSTSVTKGPEYEEYNITFYEKEGYSKKNSKSIFSLEFSTCKASWFWYRDNNPIDGEVKAENIVYLFQASDDKSILATLSSKKYEVSFYDEDEQPDFDEIIKRHYTDIVNDVTFPDSKDPSILNLGFYDFTIKLPESWIDNLAVQTTVTTRPDNSKVYDFEFCEKYDYIEKEHGEDGWMWLWRFSQDIPEDVDMVKNVGEVEIDGVIYFLTKYWPTDVRFAPEHEDDYKKLYMTNEMNEVEASLSTEIYNFIDYEDYIFSNKTDDSTGYIENDDSITITKNSYSYIANTINMLYWNYNGKPITAIADGAFADYIFTRIFIIPETVTSIGENAFPDIDDLEIHGKAGSYAEQYANEHNIKFVAI